MPRLEGAFSSINPCLPVRYEGSMRPVVATLPGIEWITRHTKLGPRVMATRRVGSRTYLAGEGSLIASRLGTKVG